MIVLYIFLGILLFLLLFLAMFLLVPTKTCIQGSFWDGDINAKLDTYWLKYVFGARIRLLDMETLRIIVWFFAIPIPFKLPLKNAKAQENLSNEAENKDEKHTDIEGEDEMISVEEKTEAKDKAQKEADKKKSLREKIEDIINIKDNLIAFIRKNWSVIKKIFVTYITFSIEHLELNLGMGDPAQTGKMAGNLYTALTFIPIKRVNLSWDFTKSCFNIDAGVKIIMKFYGILLTLLKLYRSYKREVK